MSAKGHNQNCARMRLFNNGLRTRNQLGGISVPSSLAVEIENKFKLRCLKVRYSPKARLVMP